MQWQKMTHPGSEPETSLTRNKIRKKDPFTVIYKIINHSTNNFSVKITFSLQFQFNIIRSLLSKNHLSTSYTWFHSDNIFFIRHVMVYIVIERVMVLINKKHFYILNGMVLSNTYLLFTNKC